jgi:hypothetical protein
MDVNEHERLSDCTHGYKLSNRKRGFITGLRFTPFCWAVLITSALYNIYWLIDWCVMPSLAIFQRYLGVMYNIGLENKVIININENGRGYQEWTIHKFVKSNLYIFLYKDRYTMRWRFYYETPLSFKHFLLLYR